MGKMDEQARQEADPLGMLPGDEDEGMVLKRKASTDTATRQPVGEVMFPNGEYAAMLTVVVGGVRPVLELQVTDHWLRASEALSLARQLVELVEKGVIR